MNCLGVLAVLLGIIVCLGGGSRQPPTTPAPIIGSFLLCAGVVLVVTSAWKDVTLKKQIRLNREAAIIQIERLAELRKQGVLTEDEFIALKRETMKMADQQPAPTPFFNPPSNDESEGQIQGQETPSLVFVARLTQLWEAGALSDEEFARYKRRFLELACHDPTEIELSGLAHIESLVELWELGAIEETEFAEVKRKCLDQLHQGPAQSQPSLPSKPSVPNSWDEIA